MADKIVIMPFENGSFSAEFESIVTGCMGVWLRYGVLPDINETRSGLSRTWPQDVLDCNTSVGREVAVVARDVARSRLGRKVLRMETDWKVSRQDVPHGRLHLAVRLHTSLFPGREYVVSQYGEQGGDMWDWAYARKKAREDSYNV